MILLIDNYDSFSYNLVQLAGSICPDIRVIRNDEMTAAEAEAMNPSHIILSPGPGYPKDAGICEEIVMRVQGKIPVMGICLGHQAICEVYGCTVTHAAELMHGKKSSITVDTQSAVFRGMEKEMDAARYHSLAAKRETLPDVLKITAEDKKGEIMAVEHVKYPVYGLQFHPESILTPKGKRIMENFLHVTV